MNNSAGVNRLSYINIGLMLGCLFLAFSWPMHWFLFCYAVLGPLHYFSEIVWLKSRQYFSLKPYDAWVLGGLAMMIFVMQFFIPSIAKFSTLLIAFGFLFALVMILFSRPLHRMVGLGVIILSILLFSDFRWYFVFFGIFLTSIIHTFFFTGAFVLSGALKRKNFSEFLSLLVFLACAATCFLIVPEGGFSLSAYQQESYSVFWSMNSEIIRLFQGPVRSINELYETPFGLMVMRFIAFAYSYHYFNWFSKTSIIGWHRGTRLSLGMVIGAWLVCVGVYFYNFDMGFKLLYAVSMIHVFLEFPLNHQTFLGIGSSLRSMVGKT
jgi:hypothetical protein